MQDDSPEFLEMGGASKREGPTEPLKPSSEDFRGSLDLKDTKNAEDLSKQLDIREINFSNLEGTQKDGNSDTNIYNDGESTVIDTNTALSADHSTRNVKDSLSSSSKPEHSDGTVFQESSSQEEHAVKQLNTEVGIAKRESAPDPVKACTSFRTSDTTQNGHMLNQSTETQRDLGTPEDHRGRPRRSAAEGVCCCYQAVRLAFLRCLEETSIVVPGLVLTIMFCVTIIVIIPTTGRVRQ